MQSLRSERCLLRLPVAADAQAIAEFFYRNREHLAPWDPAPPKGFWTEAFWKPRIAQALLEYQRAQSIRLHVFLQESGQLIGMVNFSNLRRGVSQCAGVGYRIDEKHQGQGLMTEALQCGIEHLFGELNFHRLEANYIPSNGPSARVLEKLGFIEEGRAKSYLWIAGDWQDHVLTSLTNPGWREPAIESGQ